MILMLLLPSNWNPCESLATCRIKFLAISGAIKCKINGSRRHLTNLPQGGLEEPCKLIFNGDAKYVLKVAKPFEMKKRKHDKEGNEEAQPSKRYKDSTQNSAINWRNKST